ncbi:glycoside hydrolase family 32 protein [Corynebacterium callunae]|uniref:glycoside hydrolase family 32 protein n=1 Tax=Corynebacterium callunae TaxID=1721 RepID=UPI001FFFAAB4|nr:glycoside hydrolase family 32 protein [Corynebacterium callunae]MCK2201309.1 glycoside hydrolase family 32 protein [Corynebacterium callunae]
MSNSASLRPSYHLTPPQGRLNDPNGVYIDGNNLHVYYQHDPGFPYAPKRTGWGHAVTELRGPERLKWRHFPNALYPDFSYDLHGCYSGGAVVHDNKLRLFYTGNLKVDGQRRATQNLVEVEDPAGEMGGVHRRSALNPLIDGPAPGFTAHYRDPMISADGAGWKMVLGAQREDETGTVVLYRSADLENWDFSGEITFDLNQAEPGVSPDLIPGGYMWECPNLFTMHDLETGEDLDVLIFCPQGLERIDAETTHYASSDQCGYVVGRLDGTTFTVLRGFSELDYGHEFYAPQVAVSGAQTWLIGWMGLPAQDDHPTVEAEGWVHCLTVPRRLSLKGHVLYQELLLPAEEEGVSRFELGRELVRVDIRSNIAIEWDGKVLSVDRAGDRRQVDLDGGELLIADDITAIEISAGDGSFLYSLRTF